MLKQNQRIFVLIQGTIDVLLTFLALLSAYHIRFFSAPFTRTVPVEFGIPPITDFFNLRYGIAIAIIWPIVFRVNRMYRTKRGMPTIDIVLSVISSVTLSATLFLVITFFFRPVREGIVVSYSRAMFVSFWVVNIIYILIFRLSTRTVTRYVRRRGYNQRHILIVGAGELGQVFCRKIRSNPEMGLRIVGYVDDEPGIQNSVIDGIPVLGSLDDVPEIIRSEGIEQVYAALPMSAHRRIFHLLSQIQNECVDIRIVPDILQYITLKAGFMNMDGIPVINLTETPLSGANIIVKRVFDLVLASLGLILLSPLMAFISCGVKLTSSGPVLYRQKRMGLDLKTFDILKFRSMYINEPGENGTGWTRSNDPRITPFGRIIRHWNMDELPQLFNVLRGDMSLVGPRPEQPAFVNEFRERYPRYMIRHKVKAGITGWAQVHGYRGDTSIKKRLEYDVQYIENWSLALDCKILLMTAFQTCRNFGN
ncbi:undecaprenyl-phosphate glucose phosphotransferase [bacterium]|nr:undecaprenyl-phosphate glucose phosphotransferase [candidate division CSSED10-310 bacterium]